MKRTNERAVSLVANYSTRRSPSFESRLLLLRRASCHLSFATCNRRRRQRVTRMLYTIPTACTIARVAYVSCKLTTGERRAQPKPDRYRGAVRLFVTSHENAWVLAKTVFVIFNIAVSSILIVRRGGGACKEPIRSQPDCIRVIACECVYRSILHALYALRFFFFFFYVCRMRF